MNKISILFITMSCLLLISAQAQDLEEYVSKYTAENGKGYMQPLADAFGANLNSGLFHSAKIPKIGLHVSFGLKAAVALIGDKQKTFTAKTEEPFSPTTSVEAPTVFGSTKIVGVEGTGGTIYNFPGGFDIAMVPILVPQISVGSFLGTEATLRYFAVQISEDVGDLKMLGYGLRHSISQYIPLCPVDIAVGVFKQDFEVSGVVKASAMYYGVQSSRSFGLLTLYGGLGYESANLDIDYERDTGDEIEKISFDLDAGNTARLTIGAAVKLAVLNIHADYNIASQNVFCIGINLGI